MLDAFPVADLEERESGFLTERKKDSGRDSSVDILEGLAARGVAARSL
jgi:hypothetical protein